MQIMPILFGYWFILLTLFAYWCILLTLCKLMHIAHIIWQAKTCQGTKPQEGDPAGLQQRRNWDLLDVISFQWGTFFGFRASRWPKEGEDVCCALAFRSSFEIRTSRYARAHFRRMIGRQALRMSRRTLRLEQPPPPLQDKAARLYRFFLNIYTKFF